MNWWESDPLATGTVVAEPPAGNWWDTDPVAQELPASLPPLPSEGVPPGQSQEFTRAEQIQNEIARAQSDSAYADQLPALQQELESVAASDTERGKPLTPYEQSLADANADRGAITGSLPYRAIETGALNAGTTVGGTIATAVGEVAGALGADDVSQGFLETRDRLQDQSQRREAEQSTLDADSLFGKTWGGYTRQGGAAVLESATVAASGAGLPGLALYYGGGAYSGAKAEGKSTPVAIAHSVIEGGMTMIGGRLLGAGTGALAGGPKAFADSIAGKAAASLAQKFSLSKPLETIAKAAGGAAGEVVEEVTTQFGHYMTDVVSGNREFNKDELIAELQAAAGPALIAGGGARAVQSIAESAAGNYESLQKAKQDISTAVAEGRPLTRGVFRRLGLPWNGTSAKEREEFGQQVVAAQAAPVESPIPPPFNPESIAAPEAPPIEVPIPNQERSVIPSEISEQAQVPRQEEAAQAEAEAGLLESVQQQEPVAVPPPPEPAPAAVEQLPDDFDPWIDEAPEFTAERPPLTDKELQGVRKELGRLRRKKNANTDLLDQMEGLDPRAAADVLEYAGVLAQADNEYLNDVRSEYDTLFGTSGVQENVISYVTKGGERRTRKASPGGEASGRARLVERRGGDPANIPGFDTKVQQLRDGSYPSLAAEAEARGGGDLEAGLFEILQGGKKQFDPKTLDDFLAESLEAFNAAQTGNTQSATGTNQGEGASGDAAPESLLGGAERTEVGAETEPFALERTTATAPVVEPYQVPGEQRLPPQAPPQRQPQLGGMPEDLDPNVLAGQQGLFQDRPSPRTSGRVADVSADFVGSRQAPDPKPARVTSGIPVTLNPVPLVELVRVARGLLGGKSPAVIKKMQSLGYFSSSTKGIAIHPSLAEDPKALAGTLAHEVGHLVDFLPEGTLTRGNLLGRLASLRKYMKNLLPGVAGDNNTLRKELLGITEWWRGPITEDQKKYRTASVELYADALSVLLNSPGDLQSRAPTFFDSFLKLLENKPQVREAYLGIQDVLNGTPENIAALRRQDVRERYGKAEEVWKARHAELQDGRQSARSYITQHLFDKSLPINAIEKRTEKPTVPWQESLAAKHALEELGYSQNALHLWVEDVEREVSAPLREAGIDRLTAGEYMEMQRIANGDRGGAAESAQDLIKQITGKSNWADAKADFLHVVGEDPDAQALLDRATSGKINPGGHTPESARQYLDTIRTDLGDEKMSVLEPAIQKLHDLHWKIVEEAVESGYYGKDVVDTVLRPNKDFYAPFLVIKYLDAKVKAGIFKQIGTFEDIANPFDGLLLKTMSLIRMNELQKAKKPVIELGEQSGDIKPGVLVDRNHPPKPLPHGRDYIWHFVDGKPYVHETESYIAKTFASHDIGTLGRLSRWLGSSYRVFHPLWIGYNVGWQAANLIRDPARTYINSTVLRNGESVPNQMLNAVLDLGRVGKAYVDAVPASWKRAFGWDDATIRTLEEERAITTPFVKQRPGDDIEQYDRLLMESGVWEKPESRSKIVKALENIANGVEGFGVFTETLSKVAMHNMATKAGLKGKERAYLVRNYAGTPNTRRRGLSVDLHNSIWLYANVIMQGYRADAEVALSPTTATGRWIRAGLTQYMPKAIMIAAAGGLMGEWLKEFMDEVPEYDKAKYLIIPLGRSEGKPVYFRLPHNDTDRVLSGMAWKMANREGLEGPSEAFSLAAGDFPGMNPIIQSTVKWGEYLSGENPHDDFRGRDIIGRDEQLVGGWARLKPMLLWQTDQLGVAGEPIRVVAEWNKNAYTNEPTTTTEKIVNSVPGMSRLVKVSDRGATESQWEDVENEDREAAKMRLSMPENVRQLQKERYRLNRLGEDRLEPEDEKRRAIVNAWYSSVYKPTLDALHEKDDGNRSSIEADTNKVLEFLNGTGDKQLPESLVGKLALQATDPRPMRKAGEKRDAFQARIAEHTQSTTQARETLSAASVAAKAIRSAILAEQRRRKKSLAVMDASGNLTAFGQRLQRAGGK